MLSLVDILILVLCASQTLASPVRRWLNTSSSEAVMPSSSFASLPLNTTVSVEHVATEVAYIATSDDCEDMPTTAVAPEAPPTWPAALSTVRPSVGPTDGSHPAPTQQYQQASTPAAYMSMTSRPASQPINGEAPPSYTFTSLGKHANATAFPPSRGYSADELPASSPSGTTTLTLYTTVGPNYGSASSVPDGPGAYSRLSSAVAGSTDRGLQTYGRQTTSRAAYTNPPSSSMSETNTPEQGASASSPVAYGSQREPAYPYPAAPSSRPQRSTRTEHKPTRSPHENGPESTSSLAQYTTPTSPADSSPALAYSTPDGSSETSPASTVTVDPVPTNYITPSQAYSYSPQTSTTLPLAEPPILPTSQAYSEQPQSSTDSYATGSPILPTVVTYSLSSAATSTSAASSTTSMAGITIVPIDPDATTVFVTVTTTEAGMTTTVVGPTVTSYA